LDWPIVLLIIFGSLIVMISSGIPVAFAFMALNIVGIAMFWGGGGGLELLVQSMWSSVTSFVFLPIPMFILLGEILFRTGIAQKALDVVDKWMGRLPGRLGLLAIMASTMLSTMTGSTISTTAMLGETLVPEMQKRGYHKTIAIGSVMGSGGLAMLIPPSGLAVLWAAIAEVSIGRVLIGGAVPGVIIAIFYSAYVILRCKLQPHMAPNYTPEPTAVSKKLKNTFLYVLPLGFIVFMVTGLIFLGIASPAESAATGVFAALIMSVIYRKLNWEMLQGALFTTLRISTMVFIIISGTVAFGQVLAYTGATADLVAWVLSMSLPPMVFIVVMMLLLIVLGMFLSALPMIMITLPLFMPVVYAFGFDPVWFGIMFLINIEMGQSTPPFGYLLFVMKGVAPEGTTLGDIIKAGIPFLICDALCMALIMAFPVIALWLPNMML